MPRYTTTWRNKFLASDATTIGEMAAALEDAAKQLREMEKAGVTLGEGGCMEDDYAEMETTDKAVAKRFGMVKAKPPEDEDKPRPSSSGIPRHPGFARPDTTG